MAEGTWSTSPPPTGPPVAGLPPVTPAVNPTLAMTPPAGSPVDRGSGRRGRVRPWWGLGDVLLAVPVIVIVATVGSVIGLPFIDGGQLDDVMNGSADLPTAMLAASLLSQQLAQGLWPILVAKWKGLGPKRDWRLEFKPVDLIIGLGTAVMAVGLAAVASTIASNLVNLTDEAQADNTQFLRDAKGTPWLYAFLFAVVIGAPLAEELFFRGLTLRAFEKRAGPVAAVVGSTLVFTLPHFMGAGLAGTAVLFASIGAVGVVFGTITVMVGRLWPSIVAHMIFNAIGAAGALGLFDQVSGT
jgi:uncharacterized protein